MKKLSKIVGGISAAVQSALDLKANISAVNVANSDYVKTALNASGSAPIYACRAWAVITGNGNTNVAGTYSKVSTTVTVTAANHGFITGNWVYFDATSGTATDGLVQVTVTDSSTFTFTQAGANTSGNCNLLKNTIVASGNIQAVADVGTARYYANFATQMPSANITVSGGGKLDSTNSIDAQSVRIAPTRVSSNPSIYGLDFRTIIAADTASECEYVSIVFHGG